MGHEEVILIGLGYWEIGKLGNEKRVLVLWIGRIWEPAHQGKMGKKENVFRDAIIQ